MRGGDEICATEQRVLGRRLLDEDIDRRTGNLALVERGGEVGLDDEPAAGAVDDAHAAFHPGERVFVDQVPGRIVQGGVQGDEIGAGEQLVEVNLFDPNTARPFGRQERIVGDHLHFQAQGAPGNDRADIAAADNAERLAEQLDPHKARLFPFPGLRRAVGRGDLAGQREHHRDRVLGRGDRIAVRRIHDDDAALGRGRDVNIINADPGPADHLEGVGGGDQLRGDLGRRAHREPVIPGDAETQLGRAKADFNISLDPAPPKYLGRARAQIIGNQYFRHPMLRRR